MPTRGATCPHGELQLDPSAFADAAGYQRLNLDRRLAATTKSGRNPLAAKGKGQRDFQFRVASTKSLELSFPGPLVLPGDDLAWDPQYPPQSFRSWLSEQARNKPTKTKKTIYVAAVPEIVSDMGHMRAWKVPHLSADEPPAKKVKGSSEKIQSLDVEDFVEYLSAFYHGLAVKKFPQRLRFVPWEERGSTNMEKYVGLATAKRCTRIRARPPPDGVFKWQLNLSDILDAAIEMLPEEAYSIILLIDHDMYEDEDDDFCCGRAYGGSRVAVVSAARYHPVLDTYADIDPSHMWPSSHCKAYVDGICIEQDVKLKKETRQEPIPLKSPFRTAIGVVSGDRLLSSAKDTRGLWFSRLVRTVAHELGHCLGMDHCVYYACIMQGTAGIAEDVRQPPYLCPVCLCKITHAIAGELQAGDETYKDEYIKARYKALIEVCDKWKRVGMFAGYSAWLHARLESLEMSYTDD